MTILYGQDCSSTWLNIKDEITGVSIGDLDITGNKVTIEAKVTRTLPFDPLFKGGDIVSKHRDPADANYLLRANGAEITTDQGFFTTPPVCNIELHKTYHIALVYDGASLKFYRNGFLLSQVACTGELVLNDWPTAIGTTADITSPYPADFLGYIDEVRIWNIARTQNELRAYMDQSLPDPATQNGLLAYYQFKNLKNLQGNNSWDGSLMGSSTLSNNNPDCENFVADSCGQIVSTPLIVNADFSIPDTVCVNSPVNIKNNTTGGSNFYWNFCVADLNQTPAGTNLGNVGGQLQTPVFMDLAQDDNGDYYGFSINHIPGELIRYKFGSSYLNDPIVENLGNYNDAIPNQAEGVQIVKSNGNWYVVTVGGGDVLPNSSPRIVVINFGSSLGSTNQTEHNWGNIGNLSQPIDLHVFNEGLYWYGFTVNATNNTVTRFDFSNNLDNSPTAMNLGNFGLLNYPDGIYAINDNAFWRVFITNGLGNTLTRLDFGNSLLNIPTAVDLGNPGDNLITPRDMLAIKFCGSYTGFVVNAITDEIIKLDFGTGFDQIPTSFSLGNIANLDKPHSLSKLFREGQDIYSFITNADNNSLTRIKFSGCNNSSTPNSSDSIPLPVTYNATGVYNINLMVDEGLPTQTSICKSVVVVGAVKNPAIDTSFCSGDSLFIGSSSPGTSFEWNNGATTDSITVKLPGTYWVEVSNYGCSIRDSFNILQNISLPVNLGPDTTICSADSLLLDAGNTGAGFLWQDGSSLQTFKAIDPGSYSVAITASNGCVTKDTITVNQYAPMLLKLTNDTTLCAGSNIALSATGNNIETWSWLPGTALSDATISNPIANPSDTIQYLVSVYDANGCTEKDSVVINIAALPTVTTINDTFVCAGTDILLETFASNDVAYSWSPENTLSDATINMPVASPVTDTKYMVTVTTDAKCTAKDSVSIFLHPLPVIAAATLDPLICIGSGAALAATSPTATAYAWSPSNSIDNPLGENIIATPEATTTYHVIVTDINSCTAEDSVLISVKQKPVFKIDPALTNICKGASVSITASGGDQYTWSPVQDLSATDQQTVMANPDTTTTYRVIITDNICDETVTLSAEIRVTSLNAIDITKSNDIDCITGTTMLTASGGIRYNWSPGVFLSDSTIVNPVAAPFETTTFYARIKNASGCEGIDSIKVNVFKGSVENGYILPNAFTPNNDGFNDCLGVRRWGAVSNLDFSVYDRWGKLIFHTSNVSDCWDGRYKGEMQPPGVYVYQIKAKAICGTVYRKGTVLLIK